MTGPVVLYAGRRGEAESWREALLSRRPGLDLRFDAGTDPATVDYLLYAPSGPITDLAPFAGAKAILSLWAGVETILSNPTLPADVPVVRMVEPGLTAGMVEYVLGAALRAHLLFDRHAIAQKEGVWREDSPPLAGERTVAVLGLGALGAACARALSGLGFRTLGWSRSARDVPGVACLSGAGALDDVLAEAQILVVLLPHTPQTTGLLDAPRLARLPAGAHVINVARGPVLDEIALLATLEHGMLGGATLDVFSVEPLPSTHAFWRHPRILITPHVASVTRAASAAPVILDQIDRGEAGIAFQHVVNASLGY